MTAESMTWSIERVWSATTTEGKTEEVRTVELTRFRAIVMLGAAGAGKTTEAERLADQERASGMTVHWCRLAEFAETSTELADHLAQLAENASERTTAFYLDALDEAMISERRCWLAIKRWITGKLRGTGASLRITCRSAVWPSELTQVIGEFAEDSSFAKSLLRPLSDEDIMAAAEAHGIDPVTFLEQTHSSGARSLAAQPLALRMLIRLHQSREGLPTSLKDLFDKGLELLASDPQERREIGTQNRLSPTELLESAERLACYMVLSGRETVHLGNEQLPNQLSLLDLSDFTLEELRAVGLSGISDSTSPTSFRFGHRQFAEYLAGRRLARLPSHQARAFLADSGGWNKGVAGPLRETAAFAATFKVEVANWIATRDPDVIGLSDVADSSLRQKATLALLDRFRRGEMTDAQLSPGVLDVKGLRYDDADRDLRPLLTGRGDGCDDVLICAIDLARSWKLCSLSHDLADLALDSAAPLRMRVAAGYALRECGDATARARLQPLIAGLSEDDEDELKGVALSCTWPDQLSTPDLLGALTERRQRSLYGAYESFLSKLDNEGFAAAGHLVPGLRWAKTTVSELLGDSDVRHRIGARIAQAALQELDDPVVARELTTLLKHWAKHDQSPLAWLPERNGLERPSSTEFEENAPLRRNSETRRRLIDLFARVINTPGEFLELEYLTPGLRSPGDFLWLLGRACDRRRKMTARKCYLYLARLSRWWESPENISAWLRVCDDEPVKSILGNQRSVDLTSEEAEQLRNNWELIAGRRAKEEAVPLDPPPRDRVLDVLSLAETRDIRYFRNLCRGLTLEPTSTHYGPERILTRTPGWGTADDETRARIIEVAKTYLSAEGIASEVSKDVFPNSLHVDVLGAMWLLLECEPIWLDSRPESWWRDWCWYIFRQLVPNLAGEPSEPKQEILRLLNRGSPTGCVQEILVLASGQDVAHGDILGNLLRLLGNQPNRQLDESLCHAMRTGVVVEQHAEAVGEFVLTRAPNVSVPVCLDILNGSVDGISETGVERVAVSLLTVRAGESWHGVEPFLRSAKERARRVLRRFAHGRKPTLFDSASIRQLGELTGILIELFPPDTDPDFQGVHEVTSDQSARKLRSQLVFHLARLVDTQAVEALRQLERRFGGRHPWLRRPRSEAERALRFSRWSPLPVDAVASVLRADTHRLVRSEDDAVDGIEYALDKYAAALSGDAGDSPEDLWNTARDKPPTPKAEEHISSKLCAGIRAYFRDYAVCAEREVEIHRRSVGDDAGGEAGSEVDILVRVAACGTFSGDAICVPIEVKLSSNDQVKTGIQEQLADRYMRQLGASHGVYVVVWMSHPQPDSLQVHHRPKWPSIESARQDLRRKAECLSKEKGTCVRAVVIDGSLR